MHGPQQQHRMAMERRNDHAAIERRNDSSEREDYPASERREDSNFFPPGSSFDQPQLMHRTASTASDFINRSFSSGSASFKSLSEPLKRSYYHHSRPSEAQPASAPASLPADFMPPKRVKVKEGPRGEVLVTPRSPSDIEAGARQGEWLGRGQTWESLEEEPYNPRGAMGRNQSFPPQHPSWSKQHPPLGYRVEDPHGHHVHVSPGRESDHSPRSAWQSARASSLDWATPPPSGRPPVPQYRYWDSPEPETPPGGAGQYHPRWESMPEHDRPRLPYHHARGDSRGSLYHSDMPSPKSHYHQRDPPPYYTPEPSYESRRMIAPSSKVQMVMDAATLSRDHRTETSDGLLLLALPQDRVALSETLCVVREVRSPWHCFGFSSVCHVANSSPILFLFTEH
jgi:hypothetical protein